MTFFPNLFDFVFTALNHCGRTISDVGLELKGILTEK